MKVSRIKPRLPGHAGFMTRAIRKAYRLAVEDPTRQRLRKRFLEQPFEWDALTHGDAEVHTLLCHRDLEMGLCAARSLALASGVRFKWIVHDDGTLTEDDSGRIGSAFPGARLVRRDEADRRAAEELGHLAQIQKYRESQVMALKLIDVRIWSESDRIAYLDSDICFFRKPEFFLQALRGPISGNYFNKDINDSYVMDRGEIARGVGAMPYERVNAGLWVMDRQDIDLDQIENWLRHPAFRQSLYAYTLDQTFISMLGTISRGGISHLPPEYDVDLYKDAAVSTVKHYVGCIRHGFELEGLRLLLDAKSEFA